MHLNEVDLKPNIRTRFGQRKFDFQLNLSESQAKGAKGAKEASKNKVQAKFGA